MSLRDLNVQGRNIQIYEGGEGTPLLYLHGIADMHGLSDEKTNLIDLLEKNYRIIAPAMPGCVGSEEDNSLENIDDLRFHTLEVMDELGLEKVNIVGNCVGGWLGAELSVNNPERVDKLVLAGASGLFVSGEQIGDLFMAVQPLNGTIDDVRHMLFDDGNGELAGEWIPDQLAGKSQGMLRYKIFRCIARFGFKPPYFYDPKLIERLHRFKGKSLIIWGERDQFVPMRHAEAYEKGIPNSSSQIIEGCGHAVNLEAPQQVSDLISEFFG